MSLLDGEPSEEHGEGFDFGELLEAVRAAATPEEQAGADEAISAVTATLRSSRRPIRGTPAGGVASAGRSASADATGRGRRARQSR